MSAFTWHLIFWIIRYGLVAVLLAYLVCVFVKKKDIQAKTRGYVLEWRVEAYKKIHRWVMGLQSVIAAPSQDEEQYLSLLAPLKFKIGYQGMEYATLFDTPEKLLEFGMAFNKMFNQEGDQIDYILEHKLNSFQMWLDDVLMFLGAFMSTENDKQWCLDEETKEKHCNLGSKVMGIALQEDVNRYFCQIDGILRGRLRNLKIPYVYRDTLRAKLLREVTSYCERIIDQGSNGRYKSMIEWIYFHIIYRTYGCSQLQKHRFDLFAIFAQVHFQKMFSQEPSRIKDKSEFMKMMTEYKNCYIKHLAVYEHHRNA